MTLAAALPLLIAVEALWDIGSCKRSIPVCGSTKQSQVSRTVPCYYWIEPMLPCLCLSGYWAPLKKPISRSKQSFIVSNPHICLLSFTIVWTEQRKTSVWRTQKHSPTGKLFDAVQEVVWQSDYYQFKTGKSRSKKVDAAKSWEGFTGSKDFESQGRH